MWTSVIGPYRSQVHLLIISCHSAAHFIQFLIASYEQHYQALTGGDSIDSTGDDPKSKECLNLAVLLSELYNFKVVSCVLVYDVIRRLLDDLNEFDVELLLKIIRSLYRDPSGLMSLDMITNTYIRLWSTITAG